MKVKSLFPILFILFMFNCGCEPKSTEVSQELVSDTLVFDSTIIENLVAIETDSDRIAIDVENLLSKTEQYFELPLLIDSNFIENYTLQKEDADYNLTSDEAKYLGFTFPEGDLVSGGEWRLNSFIEIDSIKTAGGYEEYLSNLDLGQARYCIGHIIGKVVINPQTILLLWNLDYATYEACPYGWGTYVYATVFTNGVGANTCLLAENSGGGDPPSWGATYMETEIKDSTVTVLELSEWGEYGDDGEDDFVEKQERTEILKLNSYGFQILEKGGAYNY